MAANLKPAPVPANVSNLTGYARNSSSIFGDHPARNGRPGGQAKRKLSELEDDLQNLSNDFGMAPAENVAEEAGMDGTMLAQAEVGAATGSVGGGAAAGTTAVAGGTAVGATAAGVGITTGMVAGGVAATAGLAAAGGGGGGGGGAAAPATPVAPVTTVTAIARGRVDAAADAAATAAASLTAANAALADDQAAEDAAAKALASLTDTVNAQNADQAAANAAIALVEADNAAQIAFDLAEVYVAAELEQLALLAAIDAEAAAELAFNLAFTASAEADAVETAEAAADAWTLFEGITAPADVDLANTALALDLLTHDARVVLQDAEDALGDAQDDGVTGAELTALQDAVDDAQTAFDDAKTLSGDAFDAFELAVGVGSASLLAFDAYLVAAEEAEIAAEGVGGVADADRAADALADAQDAAQFAIDMDLAAVAADGLFDAAVAADSAAATAASEAADALVLANATATVAAATNADALALISSDDANAADTAAGIADQSNASALASDAAADAAAAAAAHHNPQTVGNFDAGALANGGDIIDLSAIAGLTDSVATGLTLASDFGANNVFIFDGTAVSIDAAAQALAADASVVATEGYIVIRDSGNADTVTVYHSTDLDANGAETALVALSGVNIANLTPANFLV
jgi:hypothetical protein